MTDDIHVFENGIKVYARQLIPAQIDRYNNIRNVHEADEEDLFLEVLRSSPRIDCFVDIGSAIGYYPLLAKKWLPSVTIHAYEPLGVFREYFIDNIRLNGFLAEDFHIHDECVSSSNGRVFFVQAAYGSKVLKGGRASLPIFRAKALIKSLLTILGITAYRKAQVATVRTITLDEPVRDVGSTIDYMQMDVQGHELEILNSGRVSLCGQNVKTILVGMHGRELHTECIRFLASCDYEIEIEEQATPHQPDGIILASKGVRRHVPTKPPANQAS